MFVVIVMIVCVVAVFATEYFVHIKNLKSIKIRVHVNGTRGKSSVTRLIAAALRENGIRTFAKTTGTLPRMIMDDGSEYPIYRPSKANIIEQIRIVNFAATNNAGALIIECMALQPHLQALAELKIVKATHGVITNARPDHLDVMGPEEKDVALALLATTPKEGKLFTAERDHREVFKMACDDRKTKLNIVELDEIAKITEDEMNKFCYVEHKENVALALKICDDMGLPRDKSLLGMQKSIPDPGAMTEHFVDFFGRKIIFVNGFAANDPESTEMIWDMAIERHQGVSKRIMIINCRSDRPDRTRQLAEAVVTWKNADRYILVGSGTYIFTKIGVNLGIDPRIIINCEDMTTDKTVEEIISLIKDSALVMGIANIAGPGLELTAFFKNRSFAGGFVK